MSSPQPGQPYAQASPRPGSPRPGPGRRAAACPVSGTNSCNLLVLREHLARHFAKKHFIRRLQVVGRLLLDEGPLV